MKSSTIPRAKSKTSKTTDVFSIKSLLFLIHSIQNSCFSFSFQNEIKVLSFLLSRKISLCFHNLLQVDFGKESRFARRVNSAFPDQLAFHPISNCSKEKHEDREFFEIVNQDLVKRVHSSCEYFHYEHRDENWENQADHIQNNCASRHESIGE